MNKKKVIIIGAGPGGLTAGMLLTSKGFEIQIFEKQNHIGGRNGPLTMNGYTFDRSKGWWRTGGRISP